MTASAVRVARRYAAVVDRGSLEKWKRDLRVMTKIYRDIQADFDPSDEVRRTEAVEQFEEVREIFQVFRDNFEAWVYRVVLPKKSRDGETYAEKGVRKSAWDFRYTLDGSFLFPTLSGGRYPDLSALNHSRDRNVKRYQG